LERQGYCSSRVEIIHGTIKNMQKKQPDTKKMTFTVDSGKSAMQLLSFAPEGYKIVSIDRKNNKAVVTYRKL